MEIIRDRKKRKIWLCQSDYIDKIASQFLTLDQLQRIKEGKFPSTPTAQSELLPHTGFADAGTIKRYQRMTGSITYAAVVTRVDVAVAISRLTRFNMNPSPQHIQQAIRTIEYLYGTKSLALELGGGNTFEAWSDTSFPDNTLDRKSSQAYALRLFGGIIAWRASKQDTVTTSTTEAELLALAQAAKEALFVNRLIRAFWGLPR